MTAKYIIEVDSLKDIESRFIKARLINSLSIFNDKICRITIDNYNEKDYIALPFPDYQKFMEQYWFEEESYYDVNKDVRLIPKERYNASI